MWQECTPFSPYTFQFFTRLRLDLRKVFDGDDKFSSKSPGAGKDDWNISTSNDDLVDKMSTSFSWGVVEGVITESLMTGGELGTEVVDCWELLTELEIVSRKSFEGEPPSSLLYNWSCGNWSTWYNIGDRSVYYSNPCYNCVYNVISWMVLAKEMFHFVLPLFRKFLCDL